MRAYARAVPPRAADRGLAALVVLGTALEAGFVHAPLDARAAALIPAGLIAVGLLLRRRTPIGAVALSLVAMCVVPFVDTDVWKQLNVLYFGFLFLVYSLAGREDGGRLQFGVGLCAVGLAVSTVIEDAEHPAGGLAGELLAGFAFFIIAPVLAGRLLRSRVRLNEALTEKTALAAANRHQAAEEAVNAERVRIASELHDLVAHALGAMTIQASAARRLAAKDPGRAAGAFEAIETTGRDALGELRTLLDVLRDDEDRRTGPAPQPTLVDLPGLAERARVHGLGVTVEVVGERPGDLPAGVELTAYRVVQDALRTAREEGGARVAQVTVRYRGDRLEIEVADDGERVTDRRLLGLKERVRLFGGEVTREAGSLRARLPLERVAT